jgi:hypothetical protein
MLLARAWRQAYIQSAACLDAWIQGHETDSQAGLGNLDKPPNRECLTAKNGADGR